MNSIARQLLLTGTAISLAVQPTSAVAGSLEGAKLSVLPSMAHDDTRRPCPKSSFAFDQATQGESLTAIAGGLITSFAGKAVNAFVDWLDKRKDRLNGSRTAAYIGEFYDGGQPVAKCVTFTAGTFHDNGTVEPIKIYAEFVPIYYDLGAYTLKPVYLEYSNTIAEASSKFKHASLVITSKYNAPATADKSGKVNSSQLIDGPTFTFAFGKLRPGTTLDHKSLEIVNGGIGQVAPQIKDPALAEPARPLAYQMNALWSDTSEPSPLYKTAVESLKDNKDKVGTEIGMAIKEILGIKEEKKDEAK